MHLISRTTLRLFWQRHPDSEEALRAWCKVVELANWNNPSDIHASFANARVTGGERAIFDVRGNRYRLIVRIDYRFRKVFVRFIGTHAEYDRINALEV